MNNLAPETIPDTPVITVDNPRTGEVLYRVNEASRDDVDQMFERAQDASRKLRGMSVDQRLIEVGKLKQYLLKHRQKIAEQIAAETGKCIADAMLLDVFPAIDQIDYYMKHGAAILKDKVVKSPLMLFGKQSRVFYDPLGVVLIISPWNYPFNLSFVPAICALVAGNAVLIKPASYTPLKGIIEDMVQETGFPEGALQVVYASRKTAGYLIEKKPDKIHFTGSTGVGQKLMHQCADLLIPIELELGGKDPFIVFDDVNLERTVNGAIWGGYCNSGQTCISVERIFVQDTIYDQFVAMLKEKLENLATLEKHPDEADERDLSMGCMTAEFQIEEIEAQLADARDKGATVITGGDRVPGTRILRPTVVADVDNSFKIHHEETFGPVVTVSKFKTEDEAVEMANDSPFGLAASVWSKDLDRAQRVAHAIDTGMVSINNVLATPANPGLPFGGVKHSGSGRYRGEWGLHAFSNIKAVIIDKQANYLESYWFPYSRQKFDLLMKAIDNVFSNTLLGVLKTGFIKLKLDALTRKHRL